MIESLEQLSAWLSETSHAARWTVGLSVAVAVTVLVETVKRLVAGRLESLVGDETGPSTLRSIAAVVRATNPVASLGFGAYLATSFLQLGDQTDAFLDNAFMVVVFFQVGRWATAALSSGIDAYRRTLEEGRTRTTALSVVKLFGHVAIWAAVGLLALSNLGFEVTALVASLGVGGIAIALAVQNILGDLFAAVSIVVDEPFVEGDFIIVGDEMGVVEHIGLKTTRLRSLGGEQIVFSNQDLLNARVRNYQRMNERRINFRFGVVYDTAEEDLEAIPEIVREIIDDLEQTRFDRAHLANFGEYAFEYEVIYYVLSSEYPVYMDAQQAINLAIVRRFRERDIEFAFPTRTVHVSEPHERSEAGETLQPATENGTASN